MTYHRKPLKVQAWQFTRMNCQLTIPKFIGLENILIVVNAQTLTGTLATIEGDYLLRENDWIVQEGNLPLKVYSSQDFKQQFDQVVFYD